MKAEAEFDVVVVGAGAGGGASAWALTRQGFSVLLLDAGPAYNPYSDYRLDEADWESRDFPNRARHDSAPEMTSLQTLDEHGKELRSWNHISGRFNPSDQRLPYGYHHIQGIGGSTLHFAGEAHRIHPQAMQLHSRFGVGADWPLDYAELEPFYEVAERVVGVAGPDPDPSRPRRNPYPLPAHRLSHAANRLGEAAGKLGWSWQANSLAILSRPHDNRPPCNYCANCLRGCPRTDKGSTDVTFVRQATETGHLSVRPGCPVTQVEAGGKDQVVAIHYRNASGQSQSVRARAFVLACGAVETPRLLLTSDNKYAPEGLANETGQVGQHFLETLSWTSCGLHPEDLGSHRGLSTDAICWDFNAPDAIDGVIGGCRINHTTAEADLLGPINYAHRVVPGWGRAHRERLEQVFGRAVALGATGEFLPNPDTFIDLHPWKRDDLGRPLARIHSHLDSMAVKRLSFMAGKCRELLHAADAEIFEEYGTYDFFSSTHVFGTCRMGTDPRSSVVDRYGRSHRWRNLFISDASVFPSSGGGESPSLTIEALAIRTAEHIGRLAGTGAL